MSLCVCVSYKASSVHFKPLSKSLVFHYLACRNQSLSTSQRFAYFGHFGSGVVALLVILEFNVVVVLAVDELVSPSLTVFFSFCTSRGPGTFINFVAVSH